MKSKGFTLAELLGVIVIISLLLLLLIPGIVNRLSNSGDEAKNTENQIIYDATDQYIKEHPDKYPPGRSGRYCITIQSLVDAGKLTAPVKDVVTGEDITDLSVMVTVYSTGNTDHEIKKGAECEELSALPMIDFIIEPNGSAWVKQRKVTIVYPTIDGNYEASHRIDSGSWTRDASADKGGRVTLTFTKIGKLEARLKGDNIISSRINVINIDSENPVITKVAMGSWSNGKNKVNITAKDEISGIAGLYVSSSNVKPSENSSGWISVSSSGGETKTFTRNLELGTYYIWVKDKAGNISSSNTSIQVVDNIKPTCSITDTGTKKNNWYISDVKLKMTTSDKESGVSVYGMDNISGKVYNQTLEATLSYDGKSITYYGVVKDKAGNVGTCSKTVKRDTTAPICSSVDNSSTKWRNTVQTITQHCSDSTSGCAKSTYATKYSNDKTGGVYIADNAGNTKYCTYNVYVDTTPPYSPYFKNGDFKPHITITEGKGEAYVKSSSCSKNEKQTYAMNECTVNIYENCVENGSSGYCHYTFGPGTRTAKDNLSPGDFERRYYRNGSNCSNGLVQDWSPNTFDDGNCKAAQIIQDTRMTDLAGNKGGIMRVTYKFTRG